MKNSNICDICLRPKPTKNAILKGKYGSYCPECAAEQKRFMTGDGVKYNRDREREDHRKDILQPWHANGKINVEFARAYPDKAKDYYSEEELKEI